MLINSVFSEHCKQTQISWQEYCLSKNLYNYELALHRGKIAVDDM